jgi:hypothetical protein
MAVGGGLSERLEALVRLLVEKTASRGAYVADEEGASLAASRCSADEVALSAALRAALRPLRALLEDDEDRSMTLELAGPEYLHVVWVDTDLGVFAVGLYTPRVLGGDLAPAVRRMLQRIAAEAVTEVEPMPAVDDDENEDDDQAEDQEDDRGYHDRDQYDDQGQDDESYDDEARRSESPGSEDGVAGRDASAQVGAGEVIRPGEAESAARGPASGRRAVAIMQRLLRESRDPERALRRVALRTGLDLAQLRDPSAVPDEAVNGLELAVRAVLGDEG